MLPEYSEWLDLFNYDAFSLTAPGGGTNTCHPPGELQCLKHTKQAQLS